jgi:hypothetical protein
MYLKLVSIIALFLLASLAASAGEIGFDEFFSLSTNREDPLKQLIPGTQDYYYYHCLHFQNIGDPAKVEEHLQQWIKRHGYTSQVKEIQTRQALLGFPMSPEKSLEFIRNELGINFHHQKKQLTEKKNYPTALNETLISFETMQSMAFQEYDDLTGLETIALEKIAPENLNPARRRSFLSRLERPDVPRLARLVVADLQHEYSSGFGSHTIHGRLTLEQLNECLRLLPDLQSNSNFILAYLVKLHPHADSGWAFSPAEKKAFLMRLWEFVQELPPVHNSLKAHVLYHILDMARQEGTYDQAQFMTYLRLPRNVPYLHPQFLNRRENRDYRANLHEQFQGKTLFAAIGNDEPLVREYLAYFLLNKESEREFSEYIESTYLTRVFAETKVLAGKGDMERWYSLLGSGAMQELKERVDIDFLPTNREHFTTSETVSLNLSIKNIPQLIVKTYKLNTFNYYQQKKEEITNQIDLDGLVPNEEKIMKYDAAQFPEIRRHQETFVFPNLNVPGVYVVEFIGNGKSSRALIRKGKLSFTVRTGAAGHVFTIYDEQNNRVKDARIWIAGHEYVPDEAGELAVPFSNSPGQENVIISHGDFASLARFAHESETYSLSCGFHVDRESLIESQIATLTMRTQLLLNGRQIDIKHLSESALTIESVDRDGTASSKEIRDLALKNDGELIYTFKVPEKLSRLSFTLRGKVENLSQGKKIDLAAGDSVSVNEIHKTGKIQDIQLLKDRNNHYLELIGKTGEALADRPIYLEIKHRFFTRTIQVWLKTDQNGRVTLGRLPDIAWITAKNAEATTRTFHFVLDRRSYARFMHGLAGEPVLIPIMAESDAEPRTLASIFEVRMNTYVRDFIGQAKVENGYLVFRDLPAGDYAIFLKNEQQPIELRLTNGKDEGSYLVSRARFLERSGTLPLHISSVREDTQEQAVEITLQNVTPSTRVHLWGTRYQPPLSAYDGLGSPEYPEARLLLQQLVPSRYLSGRNIGDELRYILERKFATIFPGNMLKRPSLLLNPWSLRKTDTQVDGVSAGEGWAGAPEEPAPFAPSPQKRRSGKDAVSEDSSFSSYDHLQYGALVRENLRPDNAGKVRIPLSLLKGQNQLTVVAIDARNAITRQLNLALTDQPARDTRMNRSLDPSRHFSEQKKISLAPQAAEFAIKDISTAKLEVYDSLAGVYGLFATLSKNPQLTEFGFILEWPTFSPEKKREWYSKYACHELSFFLFKKDPEFFKSVIKPYLANKKDKTFMDHWLLEADLNGYLNPWSYGRLNIVERILLARQLKDQWESTKRHVTDRFDLLPPDVEAFNRLFDTALKSSALETDDRFGLEDQKKSVMPQAMVPKPAMRMMAPPPPPPPPSPSSSRGMGAASGMATGKLMSKAKVMREEKEEAFDSEADCLEMGDSMDSGAMPMEEKARMDFNEFASDERRRDVSRQFYRKLDKTEEWVENNYYQLPIEQQVADLVKVNGFWNDFAATPTDRPFLSTHIAQAAGNFTEMLLALAVLDLPFKAGKHDITYLEALMKMKPAYDTVIFHKEIRSTEVATGAQSLLTSQNFFAVDDRYTFKNNEKFDKFVTEEFQSQRVYGCQIVVTNPTSTRKKVDVLVQIPSGAIPIENGFYTKSTHMSLEPFSTQTMEFKFYFPMPGTFAHYPVHVSENETVIAHTAPFVFKVVDQLTKFDTTSWEHISQHGSDQEVLKFLDENNIDRLDLSLIAFRMREPDMFKKTIVLLKSRHVYHETLWSYSLLHKDAAVIREYLPFTAIAGRAGSNLQSDLLTIDPVVRHMYQHKEYWPLVNARVYQLGKKRKILNDQFFQQYMRLLEDLRYRKELTDVDRLAVVYYLLLQDRIEEAQVLFGKVQAGAIVTMLQYDYLKCFMAFLAEQPAEALEVARKYADHPVDRWRKLFLDVIAQAEEIQSGVAQVLDKEDRTQSQTKLADTAPHFDFKVENRQIILNYQNLNAVRINYYPMDIELLFSKNPFVQEVSGQFSIIHPNESAVVDLMGSKSQSVLDLPEKFRDQNVMVEMVGGGLTRSQAYYPHSLRIQILENYGQVKVAQETSGKPLAKVYVKVFARMKSGAVEFYKDGYTDLRGRFDYTSLSTNQQDNVDKFAILIMSESNGAVVREASPPKM